MKNNFYHKRTKSDILLTLQSIKSKFTHLNKFLSFYSDVGKYTVLADVVLTQDFWIKSGIITYFMKQRK